MEADTTVNVAIASDSQLNNITSTNTGHNLPLKKRPIELDESSADEDHYASVIKVSEGNTEANALPFNRKRFKSWQNRPLNCKKPRFPRHVNRYLETTSNLSPISEITLNLLDASLNTPKSQSTSSKAQKLATGKNAAASAGSVEDQLDTPVRRRPTHNSKRFSRLLQAANKYGEFIIPNSIIP